MVGVVAPDQQQHGQGLVRPRVEVDLRSGVGRFLIVADDDDARMAGDVERRVDDDVVGTEGLRSFDGELKVVVLTVGLKDPILKICAENQNKSSVQ